jgi:hypothetical protein
MNAEAETPGSPGDRGRSPYWSLWDDWVRAMYMMESARGALDHALAPNEDLFLKVYDSMSGADIEPRILKDITREQLENARTVSKAALIVFTQALMDGHVYRCIRAIATVAPTYRLQVLIRMRRDLPLREELFRIERDPLLVKMDCLIELCKPPKDWGTGLWDREDLQQAIRLRNKIVHEAKLLDGIEEGDFDHACSVLTGVGPLALKLVDYRFGDQLGKNSDVEFFS